MNKDLFQRFDQMKKEFGERAGLSDEAYVEIVLSTGKVFVVTQVIDVQDSFVHVDARDLVDPEERPLSIVVPYHQINFVQFTKHRPKPKKTGFLG